MIRSVTLLAASLSLGLAGYTQAPCSDEAYSQFDFWVGDWVVSTPDGTIAGTNTITKEEQGCLVLEKWSSANGGTGQSYNYYDPARQKWRQVWVSSTAMIDYEGGLTETGSMKLEGTITYLANAQTAPFTGEWTLNENGTVKQYFEQYDAESDTWKHWFTGLYSPIRPQLAPED